MTPTLDGLLRGHRAFVTAAASGIGRATARLMALHGAQVAVTDIDLDGARAVASEIGGNAHALDVTSPDALQRALEAAAAEMGGLSIMHNNAGGGLLSPLHEYKTEQ